MDWVGIVIAVLSFGGTALLYRQNRRKATAEAKKAEVEADDVVMQTSERVLKMVREQMEQQNLKIVSLETDMQKRMEEIRAQDSEIRSLRNEIQRLKQRLSCLIERTRDYWQTVIDLGGNPDPLPDWIAEYFDEEG